MARKPKSVNDEQLKAQLSRVLSLLEQLLELAIAKINEEERNS